MSVRLACTVLMMLALGNSSAAQAPTMQWLMPLVGVWDTHDTYRPRSGKPIVEQAVRTCRLVMNDAYLECETVASRPEGRGRAYRFLLNYNRNASRFEMLSIWSNVPHKLVQQLAPDATRQRWVFTNLAVIGDNEPAKEHWSELVFESRDRIVWTGRHLSAGDDPRTAPISFTEVWSRRTTR